MKYVFFGFLSIVLITSIAAQDHILGTTNILNSTFHHVSIHINIVGDVNRNASCTIEYKETNNQNYLRSAKVMRAHPNMNVDGSNLNRNHFAASALFLEPNTSYNIKITIDDPDNDSSIIENLITTTKAFPISTSGVTPKYVIPGTGNGQGTENAPFLGLQDAASNAEPGDIILAKPGVYAPFQIIKGGNLNAPISFKSEILHEAIIDGNNTNRAIITVGDYDVAASHHIIDGFTIQNGNWAIDAQHTSFLTVQNNIIQDVEFGFYNRREGNTEHDQYIHNNVFIGRTTWPQLNGEIPPGRAIDIRGNNNVISYNTISGFADGVSCDGAPYQSSYSLDIHNNEIYNMVDDFIEIDGNISNTRVYNNRGYNGRMGVSLAPVFGGPVYIFRNAFYNLETSTFKMNRKPAGLVIAHNLGVKTGNGMASDAGWQNTLIKNNVIIGTRYCFEEYNQVNIQTADWDYNAYYSTRAGNSGEPWFKWEGNRYSTIQELAASTSIESHGVTTSLSDFETMYIPQTYSLSYNPADQDHRLSTMSSLINIGTNLDNINLPYVTDGSPDIGPYEYGKELPKYGADFDGIVNNKSELVELEYRLYPNPTSGIIQISNTHEAEELIIYNITGQKIKILPLTKNENTINLSELNNGIYWIELTHNGDYIFKRKALIINQ